MTLYAHCFDTIFGKMQTTVEENGLLRNLVFCSDENAPRNGENGTVDGQPVVWDAARCAHVVTQLDEYFQGKRQTFSLSLAPCGTPFQGSVWQELARIPYGATVSYGALAEKLGRPGASRAVGRANATNPIAIVVPCHRVIGANGKLTGYAYGLTVKERLLALERGNL